MLVVILLIAVVWVLPLFAQQNPEPVGIITDHSATPGRAFITGSIPRSDLERILYAGVRAPSARNAQPWHFTVVQNLAMMRRIINDAVEGNAIIIVSAAGDSRTNNVEILDCALAVQSINLAALQLGYGARIYTNPVSTINQNLLGELRLPAGHSAVAVVRIGRVNVDAVSAPSARQPFNSKVTFR